ncbi:MAG TPA: nitroreductase/quinone reductase family protein [Acidimicrobiales bacterium]|nr:nitroreductase/quinone reductase family protein [Acidimicrobiales bacterium]
MTKTIDPATTRYLAPTAGDRIFNRFAGWLTRHGVSISGSRELRIVGRKSGQIRTNVVNLLVLNGERYLVAPRGITEWVRNLRAAGQGELKVGRRVEAFRAEELADADKPPALREYLERWAWEVGRFFEGIDASSPDEDLLAIAPGFPVFRLLEP